jgi:selenocysteine lyase/cysteine desulfurase
MTLAEILSDEALRQHEFPVTKECIFLAHAGNCPLPRRVAEAIQTYATQASMAAQENPLFPKVLLETKALAAKLLNATPDEIALVGPTSNALSLIANGFKTKRHENILVYFDDYPSNVYPWMKLADRGVEVRFLNARELGRIRPMDVIGQVDEQTRLVALASCHFVSGFRIDHQAIGEALHARNIQFSVDGIQTLGAFPTTVEHIDYLAADAHKWLLGPCAAGILYVNKAHHEKLWPTVYGWNNLRCPNFTAQEELEFKKGAQRYEAGSHNWLGMVGMHAALGLLEEIGVENIARELIRKRAWVVPALQAKGYTVFFPNIAPENASGIITFSKSDTDMAALHAKLEAAKIITSLRTNRAGQQFIRLSPHFYTTDAELNRVLELL